MYESGKELEVGPMIKEPGPADEPLSDYALVAGTLVLNDHRACVFSMLGLWNGRFLDFVRCLRYILSDPPCDFDRRAQGLFGGPCFFDAQ